MKIKAQKEELIRQVEETGLNAGELAFWWLGQHSFILKIAGCILYLDAFLTDIPGRLVPPLLTPDQITHADLFLGTHDHADHIDREAWPVLAEASPKASFVVPELLKKSLAEDLNISSKRFIGIDDGQTIQFDGLHISAIASAHEFLDRDKVTGHYPYLGFIIEADGVTVYHAGDTCIYEGMITKLQRWDFDLMMLPINGRDAERLKANLIGNMTFQEAVDLAGTLKTRYVVPAHYDMFRDNPGDPKAFADYMGVKFPGVQALIPNYGERVILRK